MTTNDGSLMVDSAMVNDFWGATDDAYELVHGGRQLELESLQAIINAMTSSPPPSCCDS